VNGRERIRTALSLDQPDAVPTYVHAMNVPSILQIGRLFTDGLPEGKALHELSQVELLKVADTLMLIHEELDIDGITAVPLEHEHDLGGDRFRNEWGVVKERSPHGLPVPVGHPIGSPQDLASWQRPSPDPQRSALVARLMAMRFRDTKGLFFMVRGVFTNSWYLRGMHHLLVDFIRRPDFVDAITRQVTDYCLELIDLAADVGAHVAIIDDDMADKNNPMFSPRHYRSLIKPRHVELVDHAHARGLQIALHSDGNLWPLLEDLVDAGFDGLNPLEPQAGMDLAGVKAAWGDRICLIGNIDCGELLCHGTTAQVEEAVAQAIEDAAPGGGYILCDSNSIHPGVDPDNFITMMRAARRFGAYAQEQRS